MLSPTDYLKLAERDYRICRKVENDLSEAYAVSGVSFHVQQAVEKILKSLLMLHGGSPDRTRNIAKLEQTCVENGIELPEALDGIADTLTLWESMSGYDPFVSFSEKKYLAAKQVFRELQDQVLCLLDGMKQDSGETGEQTMSM